jgi:hypothetical protein
VLHVTNGESVSLAEAHLLAVYWNDVLHEGPVPRLPLTELSLVRSGYIAQAKEVRTGVAQRGTGQRVAHVVEILDEAYRVARH